jgi:adenylate cyclase
VVGFSRLAAADEDRTLARLRALSSDLIAPAIAVHKGRVVKRTGDGLLLEFRSVVDAARCAIELQHGMIERNTSVPAERRVEFRIGIHLGDVVEEADGELMGYGVNIVARLEGIAEPSAICSSDDAYRQVKGGLNSQPAISARKNSRTSPIRSGSFSLEIGAPADTKSAPTPAPKNPARRASPSLSWRSPILAAARTRSISSMASPSAPTSRRYEELS